MVKRTIKILKATTKYQKEAGDKYIIAIENGKTVTAVHVLNVLGLGNWNVILIAENGRYVTKKILKGFSSRTQALAYAKAYVRKH